MPSVKNVNVTSNRAVKINGLEGIELAADATDTGSGEKVKLYQMVLFENGNYILAQGSAGTEFAGEFLPEFKKIANGIKLK